MPAEPLDADLRSTIPDPHQISVSPPAEETLAELTFAERYEVRAQLGEGGMGEVRLCRDRRIGREIALKAMRPQHDARGDLRARFLREARVQGQLEHPSIVPVYDLGRDPEGNAFFTMKRVRGLTFQEVVAALAAGDPDAVRTYSRRRLLTAFSQVCLAVDFAHSRGILHRDLKPSNVMLGNFGEVYVLDWGLAKLIASAPSNAQLPPASSEPAGLTAVGEAMGTLGYMAPEQAKGEVDLLDGRADVYSLGAILFELLALEPLHDGGTPAALFASTLETARARPSERLPDRLVPPELEAVCVQATALNRLDRYRSAHELSDAIESYLDGDRDLERRRRLADEHARAGAEYAAAAQGSDERALAARSQAMEEVGRALALDPGHADAVRTLLRLLTRPPEELPPDAAAELRRNWRARQRGAGRIMALGFSLWFAFLPTGIARGIRSWPIVVVASAVFGAAAIVAWLAARYPRRDGRFNISVPIAGAAACLALSATDGPFITVPTIAAILALVYMLGAGRRSILVVPLMCLTFLLPAGLEMAGLVSPTTILHDGVMTIVPRAANMTYPSYMLILLATNVLLVTLAAVLASKYRDVLVKAERRNAVQAWQLRQLVPPELRAAASSPSDDARPPCKV